ncbi:MAG: efflux RND transporter periplasmic adaptor subunit [Gammaproteobacteria bacterium]|nr:efflux RND transporter periplasmic adaptor subunit [Gammaproteobacteria bacterium]
MKIIVLFLGLVLSSQPQALELEGRSEFSKRVMLNVAVSGFVDKIAVQHGQLVKRGQVLLTLDQSHYQLMVDQARASVAALEPELAQMQSELDKAQELFDRDSLALVAMQQAEYNYQIAQSRLEIEIGKLKDAELDLQHTQMRAPIDGVVLRINTHVSRYINAQVSDPTLITLVDNRAMLAVTSLTSDQWDLALVGKNARIVYRNKFYPGRVLAVDYDQATQSTNSPTFELRVLFVASGEIPANMPVTIQIQD